MSTYNYVPIAEARGYSEIASKQLESIIKFLKPIGFFFGKFFNVSNEGI